MVMGMNKKIRKKLIDLLDDFPVQMEWHDNAELANYLFSNGIVIPVRCKDCKWYRPPFCLLNDNKHGYLNHVLPEHFCAYGERDR
jgi:hypothetical protein